MIYKSLDTIPFKVFFKIIETGFTFLLSKEEKESEDFSQEEIEKFDIIWSKIYKQYLELTPNEEERRLLNIEREIEFFQSKYKLVIMCCDCLSFDWEDDLVAILKGFGYKITEENYLKDIETIVRESESLLIKCDKFINLLPEKKEGNSKKVKIDVDEMFASFSAILGIDFDYNTVSVTKTFALQKQVEVKIKSLESQNKTQ